MVEAAMEPITTEDVTAMFLLPDVVRSVAAILLLADGAPWFSVVAFAVGVGRSKCSCKEVV